MYVLSISSLSEVQMVSPFFYSAEVSLDRPAADCTLGSFLAAFTLQMNTNGRHCLPYYIKIMLTIGLIVEASWACLLFPLQPNPGSNPMRAQNSCDDVAVKPFRLKNHQECKVKKLSYEVFQGCQRSYQYAQLLSQLHVGCQLGANRPYQQTKN